jgi:bifunctional non-homologous end joining protein LigD
VSSNPHVFGVLSSADLCHPMIARAPFTREGWIFELKHDGFRAFARAGATPDLRSRSGRSLADAFPEVVAVLRSLPDAVFDGELVVPDHEGLSDFEALRRRSLLTRPREIARSAIAPPAVLVVFDVLELNGDDTRELALSECRNVLQWYGLAARGVQLIDHLETHGDALFREMARHDQEGIVAKRLDAPYRAGKQPTWLKIKNKSYSRRGAVAWQGH